MGREDGHAILSSACFQLGIAGAQITRSFSLLIQHTGLTHKQVGLLAVVDAGVATSQREIATQLHVAPSLGGHTRRPAHQVRRRAQDTQSERRRVQTIEITTKDADY